jgi:predicted regulator of Ras-like GTPase activity (Roadblock/LC7/MglB family)
VEIVLQRLTELDEVKNAILVGKDGLIVASVMRSEDEEMVSALSATTFGSISDYTTQVKTGETRQVMIETQAGMVYMQEAGDLLLTVLTHGTGNPGRIRLEMKKACRQLMQMINNY